MRRAGTRRLAWALAIAGGVDALLAFGCSLGLDPSLIGRDAGAADGAGPSDSGGNVDGDAKTMPPSDAPVSTDGAGMVDGGACNTDQDCKALGTTGGACVTGATCDPTWHVCTLDVCGSSQGCMAEICQSGGTCSLPAKFGFTAASFSVSVGGPAGTPQGIQTSIAAAWPFVFVATTNGLAAYNVFDPTNGAPPVVPVHGVPFIPSAAIAIGRRVYFVTASQGGGPEFRQAIAWVDVPQNPLLTSLQATSAWVQTDQKTLAAVYTTGAAGLFMVSSATLLPTAIASPPIDDTTSLTSFACAGLPTSAALVASTGSRLLSYRYDGASQHPNFALVDNAGQGNKDAGTTSATTTAELAFTAFGPMDSQTTFVTGSDGSVVWESAPLDELDTGGSDGVASARIGWLVDTPSAGNFDATHYVDLTTYSPAAGGQVVGIPGWVDANTLLGISAFSSSSLTTSVVQVVTKSPLTVVPNKSQALTVPPAAIAVASSNGFAYVLEQTDPSRNQTCTVQIFAPSCGGDQ